MPKILSARSLTFPQAEMEATISSAYRRTEERNSDKYNSKKQKLYAIDKIERFINDHYNFRYNVIKSSLEFKTLEESNFKEFMDYDENSLLRKLHKGGVKCNMTQINNLLRSDFVQIRSFH